MNIPRVIYEVKDEEKTVKVMRVRPLYIPRGDVGLLFVVASADPNGVRGKRGNPGVVTKS